MVILSLLERVAVRSCNVNVLNVKKKKGCKRKMKKIEKIKAKDIQKVSYQINSTIKGYKRILLSL